MKKKPNFQKEKTKFRSTKAWKEFRARMREKQKTDPVTGAKLTRQSNLHHMDLNEDHYTDISDESHFVFLNNATHKCVHFLFLKSKPKEWRNRLERLIPILEEMERLNGEENQ